MSSDKGAAGAASKEAAEPALLPLRLAPADLDFFDVDEAAGFDLDSPITADLPLFSELDERDFLVVFAPEVRVPPFAMI